MAAGAENTCNIGHVSGSDGIWPHRGNDAGIRFQLFLQRNTATYRRQLDQWQRRCQPRRDICQLQVDGQVSYFLLLVEQPGAHRTTTGVQDDRIIQIGAPGRQCRAAHIRIQGTGPFGHVGNPACETWMMKDAA